ncbi:MAG: MBL fold metallo-hydrolase [Bacilli bacterium]|nr:MBL fold metallo-hydrolase [Bacilli bacterium]
MLTVNCQSSIKITGEKIIYFDPLKVEESHDADLILITHTHWDHFSKEDILKIKKESTKIIGPKDSKEEILTLGFSEDNIYIVEPKEELSLYGVIIKTVPAYNKTKTFHPKENKWLGYVVKIEDTIYYVMGDTDALEENKSINCDVLCIPIGGTYTMNATEAAEFTNILNPKKVIPIHYGLVVGTEYDLDTFKQLLNKKIEVEEKITI